MKVFTLLTVAVLLMVSADVAFAGFGCPLNQYQCNSHCKSIRCRAGYCDAATLWMRCTCTGCSGKKRSFTLG
uniref:Invertebrate defensins family profile domain-containing protein n=1 Tax=Magallana gigas TaxID=29159 RepID=A0A8W8M086_MAGGI